MGISRDPPVYRILLRKKLALEFVKEEISLICAVSKTWRTSDVWSLEDQYFKLEDFSDGSLP